MVTPSGRRAQFDHFDLEGYAVFHYLDGEREEGTLHPRLLRVWQAGRERPAPMRVVG